MAVPKPGDRLNRICDNAWGGAWADSAGAFTHQRSSPIHGLEGLLEVAQAQDSPKTLRKKAVGPKNPEMRGRRALAKPQTPNPKPQTPDPRP